LVQTVGVTDGTLITEQNGEARWRLSSQVILTVIC
jgi:hypothetical protein